MDETRDVEIRLHPRLLGREISLSKSPAMLWIANHDDLPRAEQEASDFLSRWPDAVVCRTSAEARCALTSGRVTCLHVISHAQHRNSHPMFSSLDFTDGPVIAAEIARSGFKADLVTLSGCDTARLTAVSRHEPDGLVRAFLACGTGYVVGSAWPLDDEAAARFYRTFFCSLGYSANVHLSLRTARQEVRRWKSHPYYWAFPLLYSGYRS